MVHKILKKYWKVKKKKCRKIKKLKVGELIKF